jgi:hypothetical protein
MKRLIAIAASLYPRSWREQYGREFEALLDDVGPSPRIFMNVLRGAIRMQLSTRSNLLKLVAATAVLGAIVSTAASFAVPQTYVSSAVISVTPRQDPLRPASPAALRQRAALDFEGVKANALTRRSLASLINDPRLNLYRDERRKIPLYDIEDIMRHDLRIEAQPPQDGSPIPLIVRVSFAYPDRAKSQAVVSAIASRLSQENLTARHDRALKYERLRQEVAAAHVPTIAPAPLIEETLRLLHPPNLPNEAAGSSRLTFAGSGLGAGLLIGLLVALAIRRPRRAWLPAGFAAAGCILATAASFLIPGMYTAIALIQIVPAAVSEGSRAALPSATPTAEFLRKVEPRVLSDQSLSTILQYPGLRPYREARAGKSVEDLVADLRAHIQIASRDPWLRTFSISFSDADGQEAVEGVHALIGRFIQESVTEQREHAANVAQQAIADRWGEHLELYDGVASPPTPESSHRGLIAAAGLLAGLLSGLLVGAVTAARSQHIGKPALHMPEK